jgi:hypothetical protein
VAAAARHHCTHRSFGGVVGWAGEGSPVAEGDECIAYQVVDRPTQGHRCAAAQLRLAARAGSSHITTQPPSRARQRLHTPPTPRARTRTRTPGTCRGTTCSRSGCLTRSTTAC